MNNSRLRYLSILLGVLIFATSCSSGGGSEPEIELGAPIANQAANVTSSSFKASWSRVYRADSYLLDVSEDSGFASSLTGYNEKSLIALNEEITNLESKKVYYYRLRAVNGTVVSSYSNTVEVTTTFVPDPNLSLKKAADTFLVGVSVQSGKLNGQYDEIYRREFSSITAEWEMKMNVMHPSAGTYDFGPADAIVKYGEDNGINVHGHSLIWHNSTPDWVKNFAGTDQEFEDMIEDYITTVVTRYKGKVTSWDVVNEGLEDGSGNLRNTIYRQKMGDDYIAKCYQFVRAADADVLIFYNDYNMITDQTKQDAVFTMVDDFIARGIPIDGVGFQMHISHDYPAKADIQKATDRIVERDLLVHFSELDVRANPNKDLTSLSPERSLSQKAKVKEVVQVFNGIPNGNKYALTVWGLKDSETWLLDFYGHVDWPLLFDGNYNKKDAYYGFLEGLQ
ncbi:endo-1,4-beta-xylanase [Labilibaculum antarcticum]|uniref:Beta-xylanase n=1 Tax=Labilibaculum antarcticum TaxID=1717717 RepID=A0A1Y1CHM8_9BACT|nr:endo-1,4-beta-xylanase [Labilibaculum antarcticum]BAX79844.1 hypothetical protein ALGA_1465 [Labilibaculum antarcticum]